ncbi:MAG: hypothetical protein K9J21_05895 [Bacteroidales bacterium]|nr:hypothetical protein [Bacteroidales bacterium]
MDTAGVPEIMLGLVFCLAQFPRYEWHNLLRNMQQIHHLIQETIYIPPSKLCIVIISAVIILT